MGCLKEIPWSPEHRQVIPSVKEYGCVLVSKRMSRPTAKRPTASSKSREFIWLFPILKKWYMDNLLPQLLKEMYLLINVNNANNQSLILFMQWTVKTKSIPTDSVCYVFTSLAVYACRRPVNTYYSTDLSYDITKKVTITSSSQNLLINTFSLISMQTKITLKATSILQNLII